MGKRLLKYVSKNIRRTGDAQTAHSLCTYFALSFSVRSSLQEEFYHTMTFQIKKVRMSEPRPPLVLHAFIASRELTAPHFAGHHVSVL